MTASFDYYIPALGYRWLTRFYDPIVRLTTRDGAFKQELLGQARIQAGDRILDLGWGNPTNPATRLTFIAVQILDGFATNTDNVEGCCRFFSSWQDSRTWKPPSAIDPFRDAIALPGKEAVTWAGEERRCTQQSIGCMSI